MKENTQATETICASMRSFDVFLAEHVQAI